MPHNNLDNSGNMSETTAADAVVDETNNDAVPAVKSLPPDIAVLFEPRTPLPAASPEAHSASNAAVPLQAEAARRIGESINDLARVNDVEAEKAARQHKDRRSYLADAKLAALTLSDMLQEGTEEEKKKAYESYAKERGVAALDKGSMYATGNLIVGMLLLDTKSQDQQTKRHAYNVLKDYGPAISAAIAAINAVKGESWLPTCDAASFADIISIIRERGGLKRLAEEGRPKPVSGADVNMAPEIALDPKALAARLTTKALETIDIDAIGAAANWLVSRDRLEAFYAREVVVIPPEIATFREVLILGQMIKTYPSPLPVRRSDDPSTAETPMQMARRQFYLLADETILVSNPLMTAGCVVIEMVLRSPLVGQPRTVDLWFQPGSTGRQGQIRNGSIRMAEKNILDARRAAGFTMAVAPTTSEPNPPKTGHFRLHFTTDVAKEGEDPTFNVLLRAASRGDHWQEPWAIDHDRFNPTVSGALPRTSVSNLIHEAFVKDVERQRTDRVRLTFGDEAVAVGVGTKFTKREAAEIHSPTSKRVVAVEIHADDFIGLARSLQSITLTCDVKFELDPEGLLMLKFNTEGAEHTVGIPLMKGKERSDKLLRRYSIKRAVAPMADDEADAPGLTD
ncbi:hypothetical protein E6C67_01955 [Azospirillum sp. TSA2s]|uniref:hypothetical protein n=1 Tax=Azospirillum sp. TSA2s TaxID=709810 RepID=UPI0010AA87F4|nr:hypothetical protein [Azospirillum sp. TSA2s]QCG92702.1 hypothetical protein E6C67_01955 [Azospirillum sp. TSA2s]